MFVGVLSTGNCGTLGYVRDVNRTISGGSFDGNNERGGRRTNNKWMKMKYDELEFPDSPLASPSDAVISLTFRGHCVWVPVTEMFITSSSLVFKLPGIGIDWENRKFKLLSCPYI